METIQIAAVVCLAICILIPMTAGTDFNNWILSFISYYSLWHAYRQHHGICKAYDAVQAKRTGDHTIFADRKALNLFFGFAANAVVVWAFTHEKIEYLLSSDEKYILIHPHIPMNVYHLYLAFTAGLGVWAFKRSIWDRFHQGKFIPWPQILLMLSAIATYIVPYFFIPISAMPLAVAIGTMFHNMQYFGFVWLFEKNRAQEISNVGLQLQFPQRLAGSGKWLKYFSIAFGYSLAVIIVYSITPKSFGLTFIYFLGLAHYVIDGYMWRRDTNLLMPQVLHRLAMPVMHQPIFTKTQRNHEPEAVI